MISSLVLIPSSLGGDLGSLFGVHHPPEARPFVFTNRTQPVLCCSFRSSASTYTRNVPGSVEALKYLQGNWMREIGRNRTGRRLHDCNHCFVRTEQIAFLDRWRVSVAVPWRCQALAAPVKAPTRPVATADSGSCESTPPLIALATPAPSGPAISPLMATPMAHL
jgi:hypothetical protein